MKKSVLFYKGLSGSGKTTDAENWKAESPTTRVIVCKDDIRASMGAVVGNKEKRVKESKVIEKRNELIIDALKAGKEVAVCDTNLNPIHERNVKALVFPKYRESYEFEVRDFSHISSDVCIERCASRKEGKEFWKGVIMKQKNDFMPTPYMEQDETLEKIVLSDCDGCINIVHPDRSPYDGTNCYLDEPNEIVVDYLRMMKERGFRIVLMSGLEDKYRMQREGWLANNNVPYDELYMRATNDSRKDWEIKNDLFDAHITDKYFVYVVIEDRMQMREYYTNKGLSHRMLSIGNCFKEF